jgi:hypothetical protein
LRERPRFFLLAIDHAPKFETAFFLLLRVFVLPHGSTFALGFGFYHRAATLETVFGFRHSYLQIFICRGKESVGYPPHASRPLGSTEELKTEYLRP